MFLICTPKVGQTFGVHINLFMGSVGYHLAEREGFAFQRLPVGYAEGAIACSSDMLSAYPSFEDLSLRRQYNTSNIKKDNLLRLSYAWRERREFIRTQIFITGSLFSRLPLHFLYYFLRNSILRIVFGKVICYRYVVVIEYHFSHKRFHYQFPHGHSLYVAAYNRVQILFYAFRWKICIVALFLLPDVKVKSCDLCFEFFHIKTVTYFYGYSIIDYSVFTYSHFRQIIWSDDCFS